MSKELEALNKIQHDFGQLKGQELVNCYETIFNGLKRLEAIDNANPSEALKHFNHFEKWYRKICYRVVTSFELDYDLETIKQYILKTQKQEKENAYIEKVKTMMKQKNCVLRYIESEDCFAVKTMLSGWYKLTPEFVDNNVREEIKPLSIIEKNKQLKEERDKYKKALNIIKKKRIDMWHLVDLLEQTYEMYLAFCKSEGYENDYILTREEFDLLKEVF